MYTLRLVFLAPVVLAWACSAFGAAPAVISNDVLAVRLDPDRGRFDLVDVQRNQSILHEAELGFSVAPYVELQAVAPEAFETDVPASAWSSTGCRNRVERRDTLATAFRDGRSISLVSRREDQGTSLLWYASHLTGGCKVSFDY